MRPTQHSYARCVPDFVSGTMAWTGEPMNKHFYIPDLQIAPGTPTDHLEWIGKYILEKKPDVVVQAGDAADMESLSSYDVGKKSFEGRRYLKDIEAAVAGMRRLWGPIDEYNETRRRNKEKQYSPRKIITIGNHEERISRAVEDDAKLDGVISISDLKYEELGWEVHPFLNVVEVDGIYYSHYFCHPQSGRPYGGESITTRLKNVGFSFVAGHQQVYMVGVRPLNNGQRIRGLVQGSCYLHDEFYRGPQGNNEWRGVFVFHEVINGDYSLMEISLDFLCRKYEGMSVWRFMMINHPDVFKTSCWMRYQRERARDRGEFKD